MPIHFVDFMISREKGDFLKATTGRLGLNRGSIIFYAYAIYIDRLFVIKFLDKRSQFKNTVRR